MSVSLLGPSGPRRATRNRWTDGRLSFESLEDRTLLATFTVTNTADSGVGSLRQWHCRFAA